MNSIALIYNYAQHYRLNIFSLIDQQLDIDFYFGDTMGDVKKMDYNCLKNPVYEVKNVEFGPIKWQKGIFSLAFKQYQTFIALGEPMSISTWLLLLLCRLKGKRVLLWTHGWYGRESRVKAFIKRVFFGLASVTMTYGDYARNLMIKEGLNPNKIVRIGNSLAYDQQIKLRNSLSVSSIYREHFHNDNPVIIMIGRLNFRKKLDMLISAISSLKTSGYNYNIVFVGDGEDKIELENLVRKEKLESQVWFFGACYDEKTNANLIYNSDLCVVPGDIGLTAIHAMMFGCPVVTHNSFPHHGPEFEAIKVDNTGSFFEYNNSEKLADCIQSWFNKHLNDRELIRHNCYKEIDSFWNPHTQIEIIKNLIHA